MAATQRRGAAAANHALCHRNERGHRCGAVEPVAWGLSAVITWALLATTTSAEAAPVATGILLGMTLGQAAAGELSYGIGTAAATAAIDPLDVAAAFLSVSMAVAVILAAALNFRQPMFRVTPTDPSFADAI